jgi:acetyl esterase/lipase
VRRDSSEILSDFPPPPADARLAYGEDPLQFGDLRLPRGEGPHPLLIAIHGGYWKASTNLTHLGHACRALAAVGIATWSIEYRRIGDAGGGWPGTFDDVALGLEFVKELATRFPLDLDRRAIFGHSAGGHLALWAAERIHVNGVVAAAALSDLEAAWERGAGAGAVEALLGGGPAEVPERYASASPIRLLPRGVPQTLVHGTDDAVVPFADSVAYAEAAGDEARLVPLPGAGHFEPVDPQAEEWPFVVAEIERALTRARA